MIAVSGVFRGNGVASPSEANKFCAGPFEVTSNVQNTLVMI